MSLAVLQDLEANSQGNYALFVTYLCTLVQLLQLLFHLGGAGLVTLLQTANKLLPSPRVPTTSTMTTGARTSLFSPLRQSSDSTPTSTTPPTEPAKLPPDSGFTVPQAALKNPPVVNGSRHGRKKGSITGEFKAFEHKRKPKQTRRDGKGAAASKVRDSGAPPTKKVRAVKVASSVTVTSPGKASSRTVGASNKRKRAVSAGLLSSPPPKRTDATCEHVTPQLRLSSGRLATAPWKRV